MTLNVFTSSTFTWRSKLPLSKRPLAEPAPPTGEPSYLRHVTVFWWLMQQLMHAPPPPPNTLQNRISF